MEKSIFYYQIAEFIAKRNSIDRQCYMVLEKLINHKNNKKLQIEAEIMVATRKKIDHNLTKSIAIKKAFDMIKDFIECKIEELEESNASDQCIAIELQTALDIFMD